MKNKTDKTQPSPQPSAFHWPAVVVTILIAAVACVLVGAQFSAAQDPLTSLSILDQRVPALEQITNLPERDKYCIPLSYMGRQLDAALAPDAKVFMTGMLGPTNGGSLGYYYFLRNYLFPRHVQISLDGKAINTRDGFLGVPCDSPEILKSNGYDVMIYFANGQIQQVIPLTTNAIRQQNE